METIKIGFGYRAQTGKDTACRAIVGKLGGMLYARQYAFADKLRAEVAAALFDQWMQDRREEKFDLASEEPMRHLCAWAGVSYDPNAPKSADYPHGKQRALYQWWGTEYRRAQDPDYWVKQVARRIERDEPKFAVISDVRFFNEFEFCDYRIRMERPGFDLGRGSDHISEHQLDVIPLSRWDATICAFRAEDVEREALHHFRRIAREVDAKRYAARLAAHSAPAAAHPVR